ncbi:MAG: ABC transporter substrate-binding protein [Candidatus Buchananbacteria bacterium]
MKKWIWIIIIIIALVVIFGFWLTNKKQNNTKEEIKIGFIGPLTGSGASWGIEQKNTLEIIKSEINNSGGVNGRLINIIYEDGKCDGKDSATAAQKLINIDKTKILMTSCSSASLSISPIAESNNVLLFAIWTTNPGFTNAGNYSFRISYSDVDTAKTMAKIIGEKYKKLGVLTEMNDYSVGVSNAFKQNYNGEIFEENFSPDSKDFKTQLTKILSNKPEAILLNPNQPGAGLEALKELRELGFKSQIYGNYFGSDGDVLKSAFAQEMVFFADPDITNTPLKQSLFDKYIAIYGEKPDFEYAVAATYDGAYILKQALTKVEYDSEKLKNYLYTIKDFNGMLGTYGFDQNGDITGSLPSAKQIVNGEIIPYKQN